MNTAIENRDYVIFLEGRWDAVSAKDEQARLKECVSKMPEDCESIVLDATGLTYLSSSGIRVLMALAKSATKPVSLRNVSLEVYEVLDLTGMTQILNVRKALRRLSVEGCRLVGEGAMGKVYQLDQDTVVKVYTCPPEEAEKLVEKERLNARLAIVHGIPTALPYDKVLVDGKFGSVFELVNASTFHSLVLEQPDRMEQTIRQYTDLLKFLHGIDLENADLPSARELFLRKLDFIRDMLPERLVRRMRELLQALPEDHHMIHGDYQMKNVMLSGDEPILIDMDGLSMGQGIFDLQSLCVTYVLFGEDDPKNPETFLQMSPEMTDAVWRLILKNYFEGANPESLARWEDEIRAVASVRFLELLKILRLDSGELGALRIRHTAEHLEDILGRIDRLCSWQP